MGIAAKANGLGRGHGQETLSVIAEDSRDPSRLLSNDHGLVLAQRLVPRVLVTWLFALAQSRATHQGETSGDIAVE